MPSMNNIKTLLDLTKHSFSTFPERPFVADVGGDEITYAQAKEKVEELQTLLASLGIEKGDKVAICSENMPHWGITYLAIMSMGAVAVPILPDFHSNEVRHIVNHSESKIIFISKKMSSKLAEGEFPSSLQFVISLETLTKIEDYSSKTELLNKTEILNKSSEKFALFKSKIN